MLGINLLMLLSMREGAQLYLFFTSKFTLFLEKGLLLGDAALISV